jgi:hypothetical protein
VTSLIYGPWEKLLKRLLFSEAYAPSELLVYVKLPNFRGGICPAQRDRIQNDKKKSLDTNTQAASATITRWRRAIAQIERE